MLSRISNINIQRLTQSLLSFKYNHSFDIHSTSIRNLSFLHYQQKFNYQSLISDRKNSWLTIFKNTHRYYSNSVNTYVNVESEEVKETKVIVAKENFAEIIARLKKNEPRAISIELSFILNLRQLKELHEAIKDNTKLGYIGWYEGQSTYKEGFAEKIECKLKENNQNFRYYPTDYVHCLLSSHAYITSEGEEVVKLEESIDKHLKDWRVARVFDDTDESGYYGAVYINERTHHIVLATRGTEELISKPSFKKIVADLKRKSGDWQENFKGILAGEIIKGQQEKNYEAIKYAIKLAKKEGYHLSFTGHSLGAWLAELGVYYSHAHFNYRDVRAVTFDSPGTKLMMENLQPNSTSKDNIKLEELDIVTYLAAPNPVNCCNQHVGRFYRVNREMTITRWFVKELPTYIKNIFGSKLQGGLSVEGHLLGGILDTFDPETGKPRNYEKMADWPKFEYDPKLGSIINVKESKNILNYLVPESTLMTIISLITDVVNGKVDQRQYWTYFESIDVENIEGKSEIRKDLKSDERFKLIIKGKYREDKDKIDILELNKGSADELLFELYYSQDKLNQSFKDLPKIVREQLKELSLCFRIEKIVRDGGKHKLIPNKNVDVDVIRQRMIRLMHVLPREVLNTISQKLEVHINTYKISDARNVIIEDRRIKVINDNIPVEQKTLIFTARAQELDEIGEQFKSKNIVVISGVGGVGKSSLAARCIRDLKAQGAIVRWIKARNGKMEEQYVSLAHNLNINTEKRSPIEIRDEIYIKLSSMKEKIVLIWDNIEKEEDINFGLMNLPENVKILITSRSSKLLKSTPAIKLERFTTDEAKGYLRNNLDMKDEDIDKLVSKVSKLPLELQSVVKEFTKNKPGMLVDDYLKKLENEKDTNYPSTRLLVKDLDNDAKEVLIYCAYLDLDMIPLELLKKIIYDDDKFYKGIGALTATSLVDINHRHSYLSLHSEVQEVAKDKVKEKEIVLKLLEEMSKVFPNTAEYDQVKCNQAKRLNSNASVIVNLAKELIGANNSLAFLYAKLGSSYYSLGDTKKALKYFEEALEMRKALYPNQNHPDIANSLNNVGISYDSLGDTKKGLKYFEEALEMKKALYPNQNHPDIANSLNNVGSSYDSLGDTKKGLKYKEEALEMYKALYPNQNHPNIANSLNNVGISYNSLGDTKKALKYKEEALEMRKALYPNQNHPYVANSLNNVGISYNSLGDTKKALKYFEEALEMKKALYPNQNHPDLALSLNNVGNSYNSLGDTKKGLKYKKEALEIYKALYPNQNHPGIALSLNNVGISYDSLGDTKKGLKYFEEALEMKKALYPNQNHPDIANSLNNVGISYNSLGDTKKALKHFEEALEMKKALYPNQNHPDIANSLNNVGISYNSLGDTKKGLKYFEEALEMKKALYPNQNHPDIALSLNNVGISYNSLGDTKKALKYKEEALEMRKALYPNQNHPDIALSLNNIGISYNSLGDTKKALKYKEEALEMRKALYPNQNHPDIANSLNNVGISYNSLGDEDKALEYYKQAYSVLLATLGEENEHTKIAKQNIETLQPDFFTKKSFVKDLQKIDCTEGNLLGSECRRLIFSYGKFSDEIITLKHKIQSNVLDKIAKASHAYGWTNKGLRGEWGVKGYVDEAYLKSQLGDLGSTQENIEVAKMLCFESMNLGVMKSDKEPYYKYKVVESFCRTHIELVKKIAKEHPEFFVDGSIIKVCIKAMEHDKEFVKYLKEHIKYMEMDEIEKAEAIGQGRN